MTLVENNLYSFSDSSSQIRSDLLVRYVGLRSWSVGDQPTQMRHLFKSLLSGSELYSFPDSELSIWIKTLADVSSIKIFIPHALSIARSFINLGGEVELVADGLTYKLQGLYWKPDMDSIAVYPEGSIGLGTGSTIMLHKVDCKTVADRSPF